MHACIVDFKIEYMLFSQEKIETLESKWDKRIYPVFTLHPGISPCSIFLWEYLSSFSYLSNNKPKIILWSTLNLETH